MNKHISKTLAICSVLVVLIVSVFSPITAYGAWNNNAIDFVNTYGEKDALYKDGAFWFGSWATAAGTIKYRTIGWQITAEVKGKKYTVCSKLGASAEVVDVRMKPGTNREYSLWKINYNTIVKKLRAKYPGVDFSELADKTVNSTYQFDSIMTTGRVVNGKVNLEGDIDDNGNRTWGKVYYDANGILNAYPWQGTTPADISKGFGISARVPASEKPSFNEEYAPINNRLTVETYDYKESNTVYWIKPKKRHQIFVEGYTPSNTMIYPDYNILNLHRRGVDCNLKAYATPTRTSYGTNDFYNEFGMDGVASKAWTTTHSSKNFLNSRFIISAKYDNTDYLLKYTSQWKTMNRPYTNSGLWLKTDGTAPSTNYTPAHKFNNVDQLSVLQQGIYDTRSGVKIDSIKAYVYKYNNNKGPAIALNRVNKYMDFGATINLNDYPHVKDYYGDLIVEIVASDNVGNTGVISTSKIKRLAPEPKNHSVTIKDYAYEDSTTKWVKLNDNFKIHNSIDAYNKTGVKNFNDIYDLNKFTPATNVYLDATLNNGSHRYDSIKPGFEKKVNNQVIEQKKIDSVFNRYERVMDSVANDSSINGHKFIVWGRVNYGDGMSDKVTAWQRDPKLLGIDSKPPIVNWTGDGENITITIEDKESGFSNVDVIIDGNKVNYTKPEVTVPSGKDITVIAKDNVGNSVTEIIPAGKWDGQQIKVWETTLNNKKVLQYIVDATVWDLVYDRYGDFTFTNHVLNFTANSSKYLAEVGPISITKDNDICYMNLIEDKYNQPYGPSLRYDYNNSTYSYVRWDHIEDIYDVVDLKLYKDAGLWDGVTKHFASGRKEYKWVLYQTGDRYGNPITKKEVSKGTTASNEVNVSKFKTGEYEIHVTMYDYNGNPSGTSVYKFKHTQPEINTDVSDLFLKVTAVKDLNWESMDYPIGYNSVDFPLGKNKLSKNGEGIKLGYVVNYSIENLIKHKISEYSATYSLLGENGEHLTATSAGKSIKDWDASDNTGYLSQDKSNIIADKDPSPNPTNNGHDDRLFFKHFIPADAEFLTPDGRPYRGKVTVRVKINLEEVGTDGVLGKQDYNIDLYTIDTSESAYDDLNLDKQR